MTAPTTIPCGCYLCACNCSVCCLTSRDGPIGACGELNGDIRSCPDAVASFTFRKESL